MIQECPHDTSNKYIAPGRLLCFACIPESYKAKYPSWAEREAQSAKRAEQLARNLGRTTEAAQ